jgi:hypothetical protein
MRGCGRCGTARPIELPSPRGVPCRSQPQPRDHARNAMARIVTYVHRYKRPARKKGAVALKVPVIVTTPLPPRHQPTVTGSRLHHLHQPQAA